MISDRDFTHRMLQTVGTVAGVVILLAVLWEARDALLVVYVSALIAMIAQAKSLGKIVDKVEIAADATIVRFKVQLDPDEVNQLVSVLDGGGGSAKDSPPPTGSNGSAGQ